MISQSFMEELLSCSVLSSPLRFIPLSLVPRTQCNSTADVTSKIEGLFLCFQGRVVQDKQSCICCDSLHLAGSLPLVGFTTFLMQFRVLMGCRSITEFLERSQRIRTHAVSLSQQRKALCSPSGSSCFFFISPFLSFALSLLLFELSFPQASDGQTFFIRVHHAESRRFPRAQMWNFFVGIAFPRAGQWYFCLMSRGNRLGQDRIF